MQPMELYGQLGKKAINYQCFTPYNKMLPIRILKLFYNKFLWTWNTELAWSSFTLRTFRENKPLIHWPDKHVEMIRYSACADAQSTAIWVDKGVEFEWQNQLLKLRISTKGSFKEIIPDNQVHLNWWTYTNDGIYSYISIKLGKTILLLHNNVSLINFYFDQITYCEV
jgi:hypothetical protein